VKYKGYAFRIISTNFSSSLSMRPHWKIEFAHFNFRNIFCVFVGLFNLRTTFPFSTTILQELTNRLCIQSILLAKINYRSIQNTSSLCSQSINSIGELCMTNKEQFREHLQQAHKSYIMLDDKEQRAALDLALVLLRRMLRDNSGEKQQLAELGSTAKTDTAARESVKKARAKLTRKANASSPQAPIKPVQTTRKNELRRK
jgi:hypothetical protein